MELIQFTAPACWASYLVNGDHSGLDDAEKAEADRVISALTERHGSCHVHDAEEVGFRAMADYGMRGLAGDVCLYSFMVQAEG